MQSLHPMRSNESPAPTAPIASVPLLEPLEPPTDVPPFQPLEPFEPRAKMQPLNAMQTVQSVQQSVGDSVVERAGRIMSLILGVIEALLITWVIVKLLAAGFGFVVSSTTSLLRLGRPSRRSFRPLRRRTAR
jgi:hypothetical protein